MMMKFFFTLLLSSGLAVAQTGKDQTKANDLDKLTGEMETPTTSPEFAGPPPPAESLPSSSKVESNRLESDQPAAPVVQEAPKTRLPGEGEAKTSKFSGEKVIKIQHPGSKQGLESISSDKIYQYKVDFRERKAASTIVVNTSQSPKISVILPSGSTIKFSQIYPGALYGLTANYEWIPFQSWKNAALVAEAGVFSTHGNGILYAGQQAYEQYSLYIFPLTAMVKYRFQYAKRQLFVPYAEGGFTYYGFAEFRDDGQKQFAGSEALVGGGGVMVNVARWDTRDAVSLDREFGLTDMWLTLGMHQVVGLKASLDMTNTFLLIGITVDY